MAKFDETLMTAKYIADFSIYDHVKPYVLKEKQPPGVSRSNVIPDLRQDVVVRNVRGNEEEYALKICDFAFTRFATTEELDNVFSIERHLHEIPAFLQPLLEAKEVRVFEYKV